MARSRFRSVSYDLDSCLALARLVDEHGGTIASEELAVELGYRSARNGAYLTRLANARLFGLVGGRSGKVSVTDRGRAAIRGPRQESVRARQAAFGAVPLYAAVLESHGAAAVEPARLAAFLVDEMGERPGKARLVATKLIQSAGQAGLIDRGGALRPADQVFTNFTAVRNPHSPRFLPGVRSRSAAGVRRPGAVWGRRRERTGGREGTVETTDGGPPRETPGDPDRLWLEEAGPHDSGDRSRSSSRRGPSGRRGALVATSAACLLLIAVPVALVVTAGSSKPVLPPVHHHDGDAKLSSGPAVHQVLSALSATTDSGSFDFTYSLSETAATTATTDPCQSSSGYAPSDSPAVSPGPYVCAPSEPTGTVVSGQGVIDTNPTAMLATAALDGGTTSLTVRVDGTTFYELSSDDTGLAPSSEDANVTGQSLENSSSLAEGALGQRAGAVAMLAMASPTGYLDLDPGSVSGAQQTGTSTVDGVDVTQYQVTLDPSQLAQAPGITSEEATTIGGALNVLGQQDLSGISVTLSIDASGYIRASSSVATFSDGGTVTLASTFSDFGCAGTVLMPGQQGASSPPANCVSPDTGAAPTTPNVAPSNDSTTTTTPPSSTTTTGPSSSTTTTTPSSSTTTTTSAPPSTTSTTSPPSTTTTTGPSSSTTTTTSGGAPSS